MFDEFGINAGYVEDLHTLWLQAPQSVAANWREFFEGGDFKNGNGNGHGTARTGPRTGPRTGTVNGTVAENGTSPYAPSPP